MCGLTCSRATAIDIAFVSPDPHVAFVFLIIVSRAILMYNVYCILYYLVLYMYCLLFGQINNNNNNNKNDQKIAIIYFNLVTICSL